MFDCCLCGDELRQNLTLAKLSLLRNSCLLGESGLATSCCCDLTLAASFESQFVADAGELATCIDGNDEKSDASSWPEFCALGCFSLVAFISSANASRRNLARTEAWVMQWMSS